MSGASLAADLGGIEARLAALPDRVNGDAGLLRRGRYLNTTCQLDFAEASVLLRIGDGRIAELQRNPSVMPSAAFAIIGEPRSGGAFSRPTRRPATTTSSRF